MARVHFVAADSHYRLPSMFKRRRQSVSDIANLQVEFPPHPAPRRPVLTALLWSAVIAGPTYGLYVSGDPVAAGFWMIVLALACVGSYVGLLRTLIWMAMTPVCTAAATLGGPFLQPHLNFLPPDFEHLRSPVAMVITGMVTLIAIIFLINRPAYGFVSRRPGLTRWNARLGGLLAGAKGTALAAGLIALVLYADQNRGGNTTLGPLAEMAGFDLDQGVSDAAAKIRQSRVGEAVEQYVPGEMLASKIDLERLQAMIPDEIAAFATLSAVQGNAFGSPQQNINARSLFGNTDELPNQVGGTFDVNQLRDLLNRSSPPADPRW